MPRDVENRRARHVRRVIAAALVSATLLAGCAVHVPDLKPSMPAQWQHARAGQAAAPADLHGWWHAFHDPALDALVDRALADNLDVAQAVEHLRASRAMLRPAQVRYLPMLKASTDQVIDPDASASYLVAGFDATWEFGLFGRATAVRREAKGQIDASAADLDAARVSLVAEVVRNWIELRTAQQQERLLQADADLRTRQLELLTVRARLRLADPATLATATAASAQAEAALAVPRHAATAAAQRLAVLVGQNHPDPAWLVPGAQPELGSWQINGAPADLLRTRPEIAKAEANVLTAAGALGVARADRFPQLGLNASMIWATDLNNNRKKTVSNGLVTLGPLVNIPLFDWGMRAAADHAKSHELRAAVLAYRQAVLEGVAEVETALDALATQEQRVQQQQAAWQALQHADDITATRVKLHLASPLTQADGELATNQAQLELTDTRASRALAYVALYKALGGAPRPAVDHADTAPAGAAH